MIIYVIFLALIAGIGFLTRLPKERRMDIPKAFLLVVVALTIGIINFVALHLLASLTPLLSVVLNDVASLFILILSIAIISGIILYWIGVWLIPKLKIPMSVIVLSEYIIQWSLIYITVYQITFDSLFKGEAADQVAKIDVTNPTQMMIMVLPSLISIWIAVILYRIRKNDI
ncbi:hypothetical protein [Streptococcus sp. CSL10205-OR2]|uniref:SA1002 family membrane protein n=1 Tax=Streptococcus sp. CSL10205-OR2 TaxID=2980558 RepID=UPI0021D9F879|nr:hypothetical protein [Streptococcus sp. CSL10205-OR2]MCU9534119.1 hypothetical protein [Streptococcus sp. CSL10205-OR2]